MNICMYIYTPGDWYRLAIGIASHKHTYIYIYIHTPGDCYRLAIGIAIHKCTCMHIHGDWYRLAIEIALHVYAHVTAHTFFVGNCAAAKSSHHCGQPNSTATSSHPCRIRWHASRPEDQRKQAMSVPTFYTLSSMSSKHDFMSVSMRWKRACNYIGMDIERRRRRRL